MQFLIFVVGLLIYIICPRYIQYVLMVVNFFVPDAVPFLDEIIMFASFYYKVDKANKKSMGNWHITDDEFKIKCSCGSQDSKLESELKPMPVFWFFLMMPIVIKLFSTGHKYWAVFFLLGSINAVIEDVKRKNNCETVYVDQAFDLYEPTTEEEKKYERGHCFYQCNKCHAHYKFIQVLRADNS